MPSSRSKKKGKSFPRWVILPTIATIFFATAIGWLILRKGSTRPANLAAEEPTKKAPANPADPSTSPAVVLLPPLNKTNDLHEKVTPFLKQYCTTCHNNIKQSAGLSLEHYKDMAAVMKDRVVWEKIKELIESKEMPPKGKPQPQPQEIQAVASWIDTNVIKIDCGLAKDPGRPTIRRLNRNEYNNTIRDLIGVKFNPADDFPSDDVGYGFDNIGDVLSMPPILLEKYLAAAEKILDSAIVISKPIVTGKEVFRSQNFKSTLGPLSKLKDRVALHSNGSAIITYDFVHEGDYVLRVRAYGDQAGKELPKMVIQIDKKEIKSFDVEAIEGSPKTYEIRTHVAEGRRDVVIAFTNDFLDKESKDTKNKDRNLNVIQLELEGPFNAVAKTPPESHQKIMIAKPTGAADRQEVARKIIERFATRAYRRPVKPDEVTRLMKLFDFATAQKDPFEKCIQFTLRAVLVSPHFLFRIETDPEPNNPNAVHAVNEYELASRLSYFLWSTMPDDELIQMASKGQLRSNLEAQVRRMLKDPKAQALTDNFAGQWLQLRTLQTLAPDRATFPNYDPGLKTAMIRETELFFEHVMKEDRSVLEFLDSDYTFVNSRLARHYGMANVSGSEYQKVTLTDKNRGGILTQASILTLTSNPTRTSPVKRGKWILENILGTPPPPPPPDVPELAEDKKEVLTGSLRQRLEKHRTNPACATCHQRMDPLGFGLENFDGVGTYRAMDGKFKIDPSGVLPDGAKFSGPAELRKVLLTKSDLFRRNISEKMLTFSLGRGLEYYDKCAVDEVAASLKKNQDRFSALILAVVTSDPFQKRRGTGVRQ